MAKKKTESFLTVEEVRDLVAEAKGNGATTMTIKAHNCKNFDGWCLHITVCKHDDCKDEKE